MDDELSVPPPKKGIFGSGTKYTGNSLMGSFTNGEENGNDKNMESEAEEEVPFRTGDEITQHSVRAKLYCMDGTWKKRGIGTLRLNYPRNYKKLPRLADDLYKAIIDAILQAQNKSHPGVTLMSF
ncbi:hypothetical protein Glove_194g151 [Diversispora epigaea]|uniref:RanBD1 domain-containing protein n=1 Tax=Diversispora epigaea TaxID=1348612 RepID=A0A397IKZ9_9GLOM|nr:hypothetical protein Glove_194g151 [Diversispora epigaea]